MTIQKHFPRGVQKRYYSIMISTDLPVTLFEVLDEFHQVCWISDDFKVEFFY